VKVTAIVVTHRGGPLLDDCLRSLRAQTRPVDDVVVVVSNTALPVEARRVLQLGSNVGYARAANAGVAATDGEILLLNDDTRLDPGCVAALVAAWRGEGVYQPRIRLADGSGRLDNAGLGFLPDGSVWARGRNGPDAAIPGAPGSFSGAAVLVARAAWTAVGGFDERFGNFCEDVDLSLRLHRRGFVFHAVPDALVEHHLGASWGRVSTEKIRLLERNHVRAAVRSLPASALATLVPATLGRYALVAALSRGRRGPGADAPPGARRAALRGLVEGLRDAPDWWADRARDRERWTVGEAAMLRRMWAGRARWEDLRR
jgi:GT2 family glycosyltransferase